MSKSIHSLVTLPLSTLPEENDGALEVPSSLTTSSKYSPVTSTAKQSTERNFTNISTTSSDSTEKSYINGSTTPAPLQPTNASPTVETAQRPEPNEKTTTTTIIINSTLAQPHDKHKPSESTQKHIILTGSTGSLGAYLLHELLTDASVSRITCLNRSQDAQSRQTTNHEFRGLTTSFPPSRVDFWTCDLSQPNLGLSSTDQHQTLLKSATHIIHNAWPVDFNKTFSTFEPQIRGIKNLIDFVVACDTHSGNQTLKSKVRLFFMSSVSVAGRWGAMPGALAQVPEVVLEDWRLAKMGYGQSKLVAERLLAEAAVNLGIDAAVCRVAQVAGPVLRGVQGEWSRAEWVPSMVVSSKTMGVIPESLGPMDLVDWLPVDIVAKICVELLFERGSSDRVGKGKRKKNQARIWHVVNPQTTSWASLLPTMLQHIHGEIKAVKFVPWIEELERQSHEAQKKGGSLTDLPAAKLLSFFDDLRDKAVRFPRTASATLETKETVKYSETMANVSAVNKEWAELWVKQLKL